LWLNQQSYVSALQTNYISDENKHSEPHKPPQTIMQKLTSSQTLHIITLLDSGLSGAQMCYQTSLSSATISCVCSQHCPYLPKASGGHPAKLTMVSIDYARHIIHMGKIDNATQASQALHNIINTTISAYTLHYQLNTKGISPVVKRKWFSLKEGKDGIF
jgi:hypothetical protein